MLPENHKRGDSIALTEGLLIAARRLSGDGLALSVCFADTSPKGRGFRIPQGSGEGYISGLSSRSTVSSSVPGREVRQSARCTSRQTGRVRSTSSRRTAIWLL